MSAPFVSRWLDWTPETPRAATDKTDKNRSDGISALARPAAVVPIATLTAADLKYPLDYVRAQVPVLPAKYRERFDYWLNLIQGEGFPRDQAERAAFYRAIRLPRRPRGFSR